MKSIHTIFYRNRQLLILTVTLIVVWGLSTVLTLPRLEDPELVSRTAIIKTFLPGADAERIEALITDKITTELTEIEEIQTTNSSSMVGSSLITLELAETVNKDQVEVIWSEVQNKLKQVESSLPQGSTQPELTKIRIKAYAMLAALTWESSKPVNYNIIKRLSEEIEDKLRLLPGTEDTELFGAPETEILVEIDPKELATRSLTPQQIAQEIAASDAKVSAGQIRGENNDLLVEVATELDSLERIRSLPLNWGNQGQFVRVGDIGEVSREIKQPIADVSLIGGNPGITIGAFVESEKQLDLWAKSAKQVIADFQSVLPEGIALEIIFDQSSYIQSRLSSLIFNLFLGAILVAGVTWLMMGVNAAVIVSIALPLSVCMIFGVMGLMKIPLHQMSITGLIVALGILIDTAIIVVDELHHRLKQGLIPEVAISESISYLGIPLLSSTLTTAIAFLPIALLPGSTGEFVGTIGLNVIIAVCSSLLLSLTIIPALTAILFSQQKSPRIQGISSSWLSRVYKSSLKITLSKPMLGVAVALILPLIGFIQAGSLQQQFFPASDRDQLQIQVELPAITSIKVTESLVNQMRQQLLEVQGVEEVHWFIGASAPSFYYNLTSDRENEPNFAQALVQLNQKSTNSLTSQLQDLLDQNFPTAQVIVRQLEQGPPFAAPIELRIYGSDLQLLQTLGAQIRAELVQISNVTHTRDNLTEVRPQISLSIDEAEAGLVGLTNQSLAQTLESNLEGVTGGSVLEATEEMPVRVRIKGSQRGDIATVTNLDVVNTNQDYLPLSNLSNTELTPQIAQISQRNGERVNTVKGFISAGVLPSQVLEELKDRLAKQDFQLPPGYRLEFGGEAAERDAAIANLVSTVGVLGIIMVAVLVLSLNSFALAALIGVVAIASFGLGLLAIGIFGYPFGFNPIIGTVGLVGVAINDSIVVLAAIQEHPLASLGKTSEIIPVVFNSTRHVLTTTLTTMVGFIPLLLTGGDFWPPLAIAIASGIIGATFLALYFIPAAYLLVYKRG